MEKCEEENRAIIVAPRSSSRALQTIRAYPYVVEREEPPVYEIFLNGARLPVLYLGRIDHFFQELRNNKFLNAEKFWSVLDLSTSDTNKLNAQKVHALKGNLIIKSR